jgi:SAM-dependent methyltransferase
MKLPMTSVRGRVRWWIEQHADKLGDDVLEIGSRMHCADAWWCINRDLARGKWLGMDQQQGLNVDVVADVHAMPLAWSDRFSGVLCSEVLEHVQRPWVALPRLLQVLRPGGWLVITTLFAFPEHAYPDDYYRFTRHGLELLLRDAGFSEITTAYSDHTINLMLDDHGEGPVNARKIPMHVYAIGRRT